MHVIDDFDYYTILDNAEETTGEDTIFENETFWLDDLGWVSA